VEVNSWPADCIGLWGRLWDSRQMAGNVMLRQQDSVKCRREAELSGRAEMAFRAVTALEAVAHGRQIDTF
jgi:hypothetical protein